MSILITDLCLHIDVNIGEFVFQDDNFRFDDDLSAGTVNTIVSEEDI
jgi:hypothetical protein